MFTMLSIRQYLILITILKVAQSKLIRFAANDDQKDTDKKDKDEDASYVRHVIEEGVSPALFGSNKYDPLKRTFDLGEKSTTPIAGSTKVDAQIKKEEDDKKGEEKKDEEPKEEKPKEDEEEKTFRKGKEDELAKEVKNIYFKTDEKKGKTNATKGKEEEKGKGTTKKEQKEKNLIRKRLLYAEALSETKRAFNPFQDDATTDWWNLLKKKIQTSRSPLKTLD